MPPKARITKEMIVDAAFAVVRRSGVEDINVRKVANELGCSTQPVMYHFKTVEDLKSEVYDIATEFFTKYISVNESGSGLDLNGISRRYLQFAKDESNLFKFIFQSGRYKGDHFDKMFGSDAKDSVLSSLTTQTGFPEDKAKLVAAAMSSAIHGYASIVANQNADYNDDVAEILIDSIYKASVAFWKENSEKAAKQ